METISVSKEVKAAIEALSQFGDTHDSILKRLLNMKKNESWGHENKECWPILPNPYVPKNSKPPEDTWPALPNSYVPKNSKPPEDTWPLLANPHNPSPYEPEGLPGIVEQGGYMPRKLKHYAR